MVQALKDIVVQTESAADDFFSDHGKMADSEQLYRFNVYHGLGEIGLEEYKEKRRIADATHAYLTNEETRQRWRRCVQRLGDEDKSGTKPLLVTARFFSFPSSLGYMLIGYVRDAASCLGQHVTSYPAIRAKIRFAYISPIKFAITRLPKV